MEKYCEERLREVNDQIYLLEEHRKTIECLLEQLNSGCETSSITSDFVLMESQLPTIPVVHMKSSINPLKMYEILLEEYPSMNQYLINEDNTIILTVNGQRVPLVQYMEQNGIKFDDKKSIRSMVKTVLQSNNTDNRNMTAAGLMMAQFEDDTDRLYDRVAQLRKERDMALPKYENIMQFKLRPDGTYGL